MNPGTHRRRLRRTRRLLGLAARTLAVTTLGAALFTACQPDGLPIGHPHPGPTAPTPAGMGTPAAGTALRALAALPQHPAAATAGYSRAQFGQAWADVDRNGCDTRNDMLSRDLSSRIYRSGTHDCVVIAGTLADPYTGRTLTFRKATAGAVQIDHVVAIGQAWRTGAAQLSAAQRLQLANDPLELLAVDGPTNESKGDKDASAWLPPNNAYRCPYAARQVAVKAKYRLWTTPAEHAALQRVLSGCPTQALPDPSTPR